MSKPYEGAAMIVGPFEVSDFQHVCAVIVTGSGVNACGHTLLHVGESWSWYVHIARPYKLPKFIPESNYMRYLRENGKREIRRWIVKLPNPKGAHEKLHELIQNHGSGALWLITALPLRKKSYEQAVAKPGSISIVLLRSHSHENHIHFARQRLVDSCTRLGLDHLPQSGHESRQGI